MSVTGSDPIAILAGGGGLPLDVANSLKKQNKDYCIVAIESDAAEKTRTAADAKFGWGQVGALICYLKGREVRELIFVGSVEQRPDYKTAIAAIADPGTLIRLPKIIRAVRGGDDTVIRAVIGLFEEEGFRICGLHEMAPDLLAQNGTYTSRHPDNKATEDAQLGLSLLAATSPYDVGQSVIACDGRILAVEAAEGTNKMIMRCQGLHKSHKNTSRPVLIKAAKTNQDYRVDLPTIGPQTVTAAKAAGLSGIFVEADTVLMAGREDTIGAANENGLFITGIELVQ